MLRLDIHPDTPSARKIAKAVEIIHRGGVAAYPTDSVYALGCAIEARKAVNQIVRLKKMDPKQKLALMLPDVSAASEYARFNNVAYRLAKRIFPGPYVLVLPATSLVPRALLDKKRRTVGIRIPAHPITLAIVRELGRPMLTTTAQGPDRDAPCNDADDIKEHFGKNLDVLVDGGSTRFAPTTVLELDPENPGRISILREGAGPVDWVE